MQKTHVIRRLITGYLAIVGMLAHVAMWRIEIQPSAPRIEDEFLVALSPGLDSPRSDAPKPLLIKGVDAKGVETERNIVVFVKK